MILAGILIFYYGLIWELYGKDDDLPRPKRKSNPSKLEAFFYKIEDLRNKYDPKEKLFVVGVIFRLFVFTPVFMLTWGLIMADVMNYVYTLHKNILVVWPIQLCVIVFFFYTGIQIICYKRRRKPNN